VKCKQPLQLQNSEDYFFCDIQFKNYYQLAKHQRETKHEQHGVQRCLIPYTLPPPVARRNTRPQKKKEGESDSTPAKANHPVTLFMDPTTGRGTPVGGCVISLRRNDGAFTENDSRAENKEPLPQDKETDEVSTEKQVLPVHANKGTSKKRNPKNKLIWSSDDDVSSPSSFVSTSTVEEKFPPSCQRQEKPVKKRYCKQ
jgi:hypothetical protein